MGDAKPQGPLSVLLKKDINPDHNVRGNLNECRRKERRTVSLQNQIKTPKFFEGKKKKENSIVRNKQKQK